jgi:hypothetical protein
LIHCNKAESRYPSLTLLQMAKRLRLSPNESYDIADCGCRRWRSLGLPGPEPGRRMLHLAEARCRDRQIQVRIETESSSKLSLNASLPIPFSSALR